MAIPTGNLLPNQNNGKVSKKSKQDQKDQKKKILMKFKSCSAKLESQDPTQLLLVTSELFEIKQFVENTKIDPFDRVEYFIAAEALSNISSNSFKKYLDNSHTMPIQPERYFLLKSFSFLSKDMAYKLLNGDETSKFRKTGILDFDDHISSNRGKIFIDGGRKYYGNVASREIIVVNETKDTKLQEVAETLYTLVKHYDPQHLSGTQLKMVYTTISEFISSLFGGYSKSILEFSQAHLDQLMKKSNSDYVNIGDIKFGVCRHRATMFKYLCDYLFRRGFTDIRCRLVRGQVKGGNHVWNVVSIVDTAVSLVPTLYLVDVMQFPGRLYDVETVNAELYQRQEFGSIGAHSVRNTASHVIQCQDKRLLGRGASGKVFSCMAKLPGLGNTICAVKKVPLINNRVPDRELKLLTYVSHPNIINLYHSCIEKNKHEESFMLLYMELMNCNARSFIQKFKQSIMKNTKEYIYELLYFLINVAKGLVYLHSRNCIHRDSKCHKQSILTELYSQT